MDRRHALRDALETNVSLIARRLLVVMRMESHVGVFVVGVWGALVGLVAIVVGLVGTRFDPEARRPLSRTGGPE